VTNVFGYGGFNASQHNGFEFSISKVAASTYSVTPFKHHEDYDMGTRRFRLT